MLQVRIFICFLSVFLFSSSIFADEALIKRENVQNFINTMVKEHNFKREELTDILKEATFKPKIIEAMNKPYEKKPWDFYKALFLTPKRVHGGIEFWQENQKTLLRAQKKYDVPANIIVAIIGVETMYGQHMGKYRVLDALTTLAFDYPKRSTFFTKELKEFLLLCKEHNVPADNYLGSYAGAIGKPQFMPSSYRFYAVDFTGNGKRDLIGDNQDVIGSVANYFHKHGWKLKEAVAQLAIVSGSDYKKLNVNTKTADYSLKSLLSAGIKPSENITNHPPQTGVIELETAKGPEFWLAYPNFYVITRYNTSPQYALAVYLLSEQLQEEWTKSKKQSSKANV